MSTQLNLTTFVEMCIITPDTSWDGMDQTDFFYQTDNKKQIQ